MSQINDKRDMQMRMFQEKMDYEKGVLSSQAEYFRKVQDEKDRGLRMVNNFR